MSSKKDSRDWKYWMFYLIVLPSGLFMCVVCFWLWSTIPEPKPTPIAIRATRTSMSTPRPTLTAQEATGTARAITSATAQAAANTTQTAEGIQAVTSQAAQVDTEAVQDAPLRSPAPQAASTGTPSGPAPATDGAVEPETEAQEAKKCVPNAAFVSDVTIPDDTVMKPGEAFDKVWRLKNSGDCPWDDEYSLGYAAGNRLGSFGPTELGQALDVGQTVDISVKMQAPANDGSYTSWWQMHDENGNLFGHKVYVRINTVAGTTQNTDGGTQNGSASDSLKYQTIRSELRDTPREARDEYIKQLLGSDAVNWLGWVSASWLDRQTGQLNIEVDMDAPPHPTQLA